MTTGTAAPARINVIAVIENSDVTSLHATIFALCALCMILDGFDVQALGYAAPAILQEWRIAPALLGPVFGAGNLGVLMGQLSFAMLGDKVGRRPVLIGGALFFALLTLLTARVSSVGELLVVRLVAGIGLGSIIPNATALVNEYSPRHRRIALVTWLGVGFTTGAVLGGFVAAWVIPLFGWRAVFYLGGAIPLPLALAMYMWLPESLPLLVVHGTRRDYVAHWLNRISPATLATRDSDFVVPEERRHGVAVLHLFSQGRGVATVLLWIVNFMNLLNLYSLANWLPTVARSAGYSTRIAVLVGTTLQIGGMVSPFPMASAIARRGFLPVLTTMFAIGSISIALIGQPGLSLAPLAVMVFVAGACVVGSQASLNALVAGYYPTYLRSTGLGWALGIGRVGAIVGPVLAGEFMALKWSPQQIFLALAVPALISWVVMLGLRRAMPSGQVTPTAL